MNNKYWGKVKETLFEYSNEEKDINKARAEWFYHGEIADNRLLDKTQEREANEGVYPNCQLCGHLNIRYSFTIRNKENDNKLDIGCECVTKFIEVDDNGSIIRNPLEKRKILHKDARKLIQNNKTKEIINNILEIQKHDEEFNAQSFLDRLDEKQGFSLNQTKMLFALFGKHGINYNVYNYKVNFRKTREKAQLIQLKKWQFNKLKPIIPKKFQEMYLENE